jgi:hypothetical protein
MQVKVAYAVKQVRVGRWPNQYNALCTNVKKINMRVGWTIRSTKTESSVQRINSRATNACLLQWEKQYCKLGVSSTLKTPPNEKLSHLQRRALVQVLV